MWNRKKELMNLYDSTATSYDSRYEEIQDQKFEKVSKYIENPKIVLDVGCGTGLVFDRFSDEARRIVGIDFSRRMLQGASKYFDKNSLVMADADSLPFRSETFDLVISFTLLQNMPDPKKAVSEMARVAVKGGNVIATVLRKKYSPDNMREWFKSAGLQILDFGEITNSEDAFCIGEKN